MDKPKIVAIVGPTASGKTALSIELARKFNGEIVSADSRQIYRGMDIGTAKPNRDRDNGTGIIDTLSPVPLYLSHNVPHFLIDIRNPNEDYTVADYKRDAEAAIGGIVQRGKLPILVGGTGLYVRAVLENLDIPKIAADPALRAQIESEIKEKGLASVFEKLVERDPEAAYVVDPRNPRRVVRALEVATLTGEPFTAQRKKREPIYDARKIGVNPKPEILRERIGRRIDEMLQGGLVAEVQRLIGQYGPNCAAFDAIGYREIIEYLDGKISLEKSAADMKLNTWHYAKRQLTWFRKDKEIVWVEDNAEAQSLVSGFLKL